MEKETTNTEASDQIFAGNLEFNRYGLMSAILLITGCSGGLAVGLGAVNNLVALIFVVVPTMTTLSLLLAVSPMKWILKSGIVAGAINTAFIVYYLIV